jgi:hypothetical protein
MKKLTGLLLFFFVASCFPILAQQVRSTSSFELGLLNVGYTQEIPVSQTATVLVSTGLEGAVSYSNKQFNYAFVPALGIEPRLYYNIAKRAAEKKNTNYNSANYVSLSVYYTFGKAFSNYHYVPKPQLIISPLWGLQRAIGKHILYHVAVGPLFYKTENNLDILLNVDLSFNFHLKKMK